jgi:putative membrane protein
VVDTDVLTEELAMMFWYGNGMSTWGYALMTIGMVVFWTLVIVGIVALIRYLGHPSEPPEYRRDDGTTPERLLAERFALGEIDQNEYRARLDVLHDHTAADTM